MQAWLPKKTNLMHHVAIKFGMVNQFEMLDLVNLKKWHSNLSHGTVFSDVTVLLWQTVEASMGYQS